MTLCRTLQAIVVLSWAIPAMVVGLAALCTVAVVRLIQAAADGQDDRPIQFPDRTKEGPRP
jgi:hypothetical protein